MFINERFNACHGGRGAGDGRLLAMAHNAGKTFHFCAGFCTVPCAASSFNIL
jgi:hypothetical protein